ncbi:MULTISPECIES: DUF3995 domain-containing protein [Streptomyces]|uniref:DUF3995 domain-containing protein n=1 Tax=Streptomyces solicathayae TaxID=3081768 RepID=A0ABZ0LW47_9ACTN|nr:DUF3995 domain-containing protein [Streptomyces sp. HUAS YS2]WOX23726.1 DUF3995 domain-containing protein [Streptomyces sp. HUAS YS2]
MVVAATAPQPVISAARAGAFLLGVLALVHVYWAAGATWPAADERGLSLAVLGSVVSFGPAVTLPLAVLEGVACVGVFAFVRDPGARFPRLVTSAFTAGLLLRGAVGVWWVLLGKDGSGDVFPWLNALAYTPLCLGLGWAVLRELRR